MKRSIKWYVIHCDPLNIASRNTLKMCPFKRTARYRKRVGRLMDKDKTHRGQAQCP